jgi:alkaline phosphatase D
MSPPKTIDRRRFLIGASALAALPACPEVGVLYVEPTPEADDDDSEGDDDDSAEGDDDDATDDDDSGDPGPDPVGGPEPDPWTPAGFEDDQSFAWGVQAGDVTPTSILLGTRTTFESVELVLVRGTDDGWVEVQRVADLPAFDGWVRVEITDLVPDHTYSYAFYSSPGVRSRPGRFRTAIAEDGELRPLIFGATSCLGSQGRPWPCLSRAADERLDVCLLLGDTVYADGATSLEEFRTEWREALEADGLQDLLASTSVISTWDDHEVTNNWSYDEHGDRVDFALDSFLEALPSREGPGGTGLWRTLRWGGVVDFFALDCRGERDGDEYISRAQMDWIKAELSASTARFKIILNSVPISDMRDFLGTLAEGDRWSGYPTQREELLQHIDDEEIEGLLWITGDFHWGAALKVGRTAPDLAGDQWEILAGPAGSFINPIVFITQTNEQLHRIIGAFNYTWFYADPASGVIEVEFIGDDGTTIDTITIEL